jgi:hypothetical protein
MLSEILKKAFHSNQDAFPPIYMGQSIAAKMMCGSILLESQPGCIRPLDN